MPSSAGVDFITVLRAAGFDDGEIFQLVAIKYPRDPSVRLEVKSFENRLVGRTDAGKWVRRVPEGFNLYICGNPLKAHKDRKAKNEDIAVVRCFLVDVDPVGEGTPSDECLAFCRAVQQDFGGTVVDSGRGFQLWLLHGPDVVPHREGMSHAIQKKYERPGTKMDSTFDPSRLMRLPGTINLKTGVKAQIL